MLIPTIEFLKGEWWSDQIETDTVNRWREFLLINNEGTLYRTSWSSEKYILNKECNIIDGQILENGRTIFYIEVLDSNSLILSNEKYEARFYRPPIIFEENIDSIINRFVLSDSIKQQIIGKWELNHFEINLINEEDLNPEGINDEYFKEEISKEDILGYSQNSHIIMEFRRDNIFIKSTEETPPIKYEYSINDLEINLSKSDYIIPIMYLYDNDLLTLVLREGWCEKLLVFKKLK